MNNFIDSKYLIMILLIISIFLFILYFNFFSYNNNNNYNPNNGFDPNLFGPSVWNFLHMISFNYPINPSIEDKNKYRNFIFNLQEILPCLKCRNNFKKHLSLYNINNALTNRNTFSKFMYDLHNQVNYLLNKKKIPTYKQIKNKYENLRTRNNDKRKFKTKILIKYK